MQDHSTTQNPILRHWTSGWIADLKPIASLAAQVEATTIMHYISETNQNIRNQDKD